MQVHDVTVFLVQIPEPEPWLPNPGLDDLGSWRKTRAMKSELPLLLQLFFCLSESTCYLDIISCESVLALGNDNARYSRRATSPPPKATVASMLTC